MYTTFQHNSKHYTYAGGVEALVVRGYITAGQIQFLLVHIELKGYTAQLSLQLPSLQWGAGNVYLLVLSSWKVNIAQNPIAVIGS